MLAGQVTWEPNEASMEGVLVADGILSPPEEVGLIAEPVRFSVPAGVSPPSTAGGRRRCC
jgi:leucyl aminopeptidase (aminopeptidase T)